MRTYESSKTVPRIALRDGTFHSLSMTLDGENTDISPKFFQWDREGRGDIDACFLTDMYIEQAPELSKEFSRLVAVLIEPSAFSTTHYNLAQKHQDYFSAILTYEKKYLPGPPWYPYTLGGSWISDWSVYPKKELVSVISSDKWRTEGHRFRHQVIRAFTELFPIHVFGEPYVKRFDSKAQPLRDFAFSVVIESERRNWYFSEKLIDCFSQGTVPIYWGCPEIHRFFDQKGIITFNTLDELNAILKGLSMQYWQELQPAIEQNFILAQQFTCAEDNLYLVYPWLFE